MSEAYASGVLHAAVLIGVRTAPGQMLFTRIRRCATSCEMLFILSLTQPFDAAEVKWPAHGMTSWTELMQMILPAATETSGTRPRRLNSLTASRAQRNWPVRLTPIT